jgi:hypothetical protein
MAERPVFTPITAGTRLVREVPIQFTWHKGMAPSQKMKNVIALHSAAEARHLRPLLEVSSKSQDILGQRLSAFSLKTPFQGSEIAIENAFQGSKVFRRGGPYEDLYYVSPRGAKGDIRLRESGDLMYFSFDGDTFPIMPKTGFYDWLYMRALYPHRKFLQRLQKFSGFTDIEYNPDRSINCQARSCATFVALEAKGLLDAAMRSFHSFIEILAPDSLEQPHSYSALQRALV